MRACVRVEGRGPGSLRARVHAIARPILRELMPSRGEGRGEGGMDRVIGVLMMLEDEEN